MTVAQVDTSLMIITLIIVLTIAIISLAVFLDSWFEKIKAKKDKKHNFENNKYF